MSEIEELRDRGRRDAKAHQDRLQGIVPLEDLQFMAKAIAGSKMFGIESEDQAIALMLLCQAEGLHPVMALRRYHIIDGRPAFRADALQGEFEKEGAILWHHRDERECAATFFRSKDMVLDEETISGAKERYKRMKAGQAYDDLAWPGEVTIIRTFEDAVAKRVALSWSKAANKYVLKHSWQQSPRQMLHARCVTEGVRAVNPGLIAGVYTEDEIGDIPPDGEEIEPAQIIERNVRQATANATGETISEPYCELTMPETKAGEITADNYKDLIVHIGKAEGGMMLGRKVGDLNRHVLEWLYTKWRDRLGPAASDEDLRLKKAVEFAWLELLKKPVESPEPGGVPQDTVPENKATAGAASEAAPAKSEAERKAEIIKELQDRTSDLCITEEQACAYLAHQGYFAPKEKVFADADVHRLEVLLDKKVWQTLVDVVNADLRPKQVPGKPKKWRKIGRAKS